MNIRNETLDPDAFYHIYNRGINNGKIFSSEENQRFFLTKFGMYLNPVCEVYAYCLMPNHFHILLKVKSRKELDEFLIKANKSSHDPDGLHSSANIVSKQIGKWISSYSQAFNKIENRHGSLLESPFKRKRIEDEVYFKNAIIYIHRNPIILKQDFESYRFSSYATILSDSTSNIKRNEVLDIFGDKSNFIYAHKHPEDFDFEY